MCHHNRQHFIVNQGDYGNIVMGKKNSEDENDADDYD